MGYSISTRFTTPQAADEMLDFLNQQDWVGLAKVFNQYPSQPMKGTQLGYAPKNGQDRLVGFHCSLPHEYIWDVCIWMAAKSSFRVHGDPVIYHDDEKMHIVQNRPPLPHEKNKIQADAQGLHIRPNEGSLIANLLFKRGYHKKKSKEFIQDLDQKWQDLQNQKNIEIPQDPPKPKIK